MSLQSRLNRNPIVENDLANALSRRIIGQPAATRQIIPFVHMHHAGLAPEGRPLGVFLLLGPTGTGKTKTVEALADVLHGSERNVLRVDCGEFQMEHEVAKLIGAPPGYLGHRETAPLLSQQKLTAVTSENCNLSIVLFDEIEKAAQTMNRLLLGVLDKAALRLGDNSTVNFEKSLIFMTSNLGATEMSRLLNPGFGLEAAIARDQSAVDHQLDSVALMAVRRRFSPEFVNRIDSVITYHPLSAESIAEILDLQIAELQRHIYRRLGSRAFLLHVSKQARASLIATGTSPQYGARELKRTIHRRVIQPLALLVSRGRVEPGETVRVETGPDEKLRLRVQRLPDVFRPAA